MRDITLLLQSHVFIELLVIMLSAQYMERHPPDLLSREPH